MGKATEGKSKAVKERGEAPGHYFTVPLEGLREVLKQTQNADAGFVYALLHKGKQDETIGSTVGANHISKTLGISKQKAKELLDVLRAVSWGERVIDRPIVTPKEWSELADEDDKIPDKKGKYPITVLPPLGEAHLYLDNAFVDESDRRRTPPFQKLLGLTSKKERLDALLLLIELHSRHNLVDFGGVDPSFFCLEWEKVKDVDLRLHGKESLEVRFLATAKKGKPVPSKTLVDVFGGDGKRCAAAFNNLKRLGLIHEAAMVYSANPLKAHDAAKVLYPLRSFAGDEESSGLGGLATAAYEATQELSLGSELLKGREAYSSGNNADLHVYASPSADACVVSVLRLRYLGRTKDNIIERSIETKRAEKWKETLERLPYGEDEAVEFGFEGWDFESATF